MKIRAFVLIAVFVYGAVTSAQGYAIRVTYNTNLRVANSLTSGIVETAPAGSILQVLGQQGRWLQIDRNGNQVWMAGWVSYSRVQSVQPAVSPPQTVSNIDNCCFVDRQCQSDQDWTDGYWAFQNGQCAAPAQTQPQPVASVTEPRIIGAAPTTQINNCCNLDRECHTEEDWAAGWLAFQDGECLSEFLRYKPPSSQPILGTDNCCDAPGWLCLTDAHYSQGHMAYRDNNHCPAHVISTYLPNFVFYDAADNCCDLGRPCHSPADWQRGYSDFLHFRCEFDIPLIDHIPVKIEGSPTFHVFMRAAFSLLKARSPYYYDYAIRGLDKIIQDSDGDPHTGGGGVLCLGERTYFADWEDNSPGSYENTLIIETSVIVHEACHCHNDAAGFIPPKPTDVGNELPCYEQEHLALLEIAPGHSNRFARQKSLQVVGIVNEYPWFASILQKPLSYHQHFLAVGS